MEGITIDENVRKTQLILKWTFVLLPIIARLDKFTNLLMEWTKYLDPFINDIIPGNVFMKLVGVIGNYRRNHRFFKANDWKYNRNDMAALYRA